MDNADPSEFADLFPDYVAECEEHLTSAGRLLLALEADPVTVDREQIDSLFRNFHTIKGLSGMVGLREAERIAHHLESYLGAVRKGQAKLSKTGSAALIEGVNLIERVIAARRDQQPIPNVDPLLDRFAALVEIPKPTSPLAPHSEVAPITPPFGTSIDPLERVNQAVGEGAKVWQLRFTPSAALTERGLNINSVRERLRAADEIVHAVPTAVPGGVSFSFLVIGRTDDFSSVFPEECFKIEPYTATPREPVPTAPARATSLTHGNLVRVDLGRLDELMRTVGELVITRARLDIGLGRIASCLPAIEWRELRETSSAMERQLRDLREEVMRVRLVPVRDVFGRMRFVVRDLSRETGRQIELHLSGENTEVDKFIVERLADPLLHLIRNAVGHGLEPPDERSASGKHAKGRIDLRAAAAGGAIVIEVEDDGRGIDVGAVFARARSAGLVSIDSPEDASLVLDLLCSPGFSTRENSDHTSGRGVGMDVVARAVEDLGGTLALVTEKGKGSRFTIRLPLTLAIADALIVSSAGQTFAIAQTAIREVVEVAAGMTTTLENNELFSHRGSVFPFLRLTDVFGTERSNGDTVALLIGESGGVIALAVDRILGLREIVVRPLADPLLDVQGLSGATELGDGRAVLILDAAGLGRFARNRNRMHA